MGSCFLCNYSDYTDWTVEEGTGYRIYRCPVCGEEEEEFCDYDEDGFNV